MNSDGAGMVKCTSILHKYYLLLCVLLFCALSQATDGGHYEIKEAVLDGPLIQRCSSYVLKLLRLQKWKKNSIKNGLSFPLI